VRRRGGRRITAAAARAQESGAKCLETLANLPMTVNGLINIQRKENGQRRGQMRRKSLWSRFRYVEKRRDILSSF